ncbi:MAG TPA: transposase, partial [Acidimicrobiales bacterium]|nr:transposase [Acidimicrobiales bacterium]
MGSCRTFSYRIEPTERQRRGLFTLLKVQRELYNAALEARRGAWRLERRSVSCFDDYLTLTELREVRPDVLAYGVTVCRGTLKRLDRAYAAFYRRYKAGDKPGYPRFRPAARWSSVQWEHSSGWKIKENERRLYVQGIGEVKVRLHRPLLGVPKALTVSKKGKHWYAAIRCVDVLAEPLPATGRAVGIDLGVERIVATSDGVLVENDRPGKLAEAKLAQARRELARKKRGSKGREKARHQLAVASMRVANRRKDVLHKLSRSLVNDYDLIVHEDLKIKN